MLSISGNDTISKNSLQIEKDYIFNEIVKHFKYFLEGESEFEVLEDDFLVKSLKTKPFNSRLMNKYNIDESLEDFEHVSDIIECLPWNENVLLINEDYFTEFIRRDCEILGYIPKDFPWWIEINWERTATNLKPDYSTVDIENDTYYYLNG